MSFLSEEPGFSFRKPMLALIVGNTMLSTVPGISAAGPTPEATLLTATLDAELVVRGAITSMDVKPVSPTGCATPATLTRAMAELAGLQPVIVNAGLVHPPVVPCIDCYGKAGGDPREGDAVPDVYELFERGITIGEMLGAYSDLLVLGESVPGGTTTALCVLRGLGYEADVSSSFVDNPKDLKTGIADHVVQRIRDEGITEPLDVVRCGGDPMIAVAAGIAKGYPGKIVFAGGTQMLSVAAVLGRMGEEVPELATTIYVGSDPNATFARTVEEVGTKAYLVDPDFGTIGNPGLARYCAGEVKEGMGAGGALFLAHIMGHGDEEIRAKILDFLKDY